MTRLSFKQDFQKQEAKRSLWDQDGQHIPKKYRNKGKGRLKDRHLVRTESAEIEHQAELEKEEMLDEEATEALYCHFHGPCARCQSKI